MNRSPESPRHGPKSLVAVLSVLVAITVLGIGISLVVLRSPTGQANIPCGVEVGLPPRPGEPGTEAWVVYRLGDGEITGLVVSYQEDDVRPGVPEGHAALNVTDDLNLLALYCEMSAGVTTLSWRVNLETLTLQPRTSS